MLRGAGQMALPVPMAEGGAGLELGKRQLMHSWDKAVAPEQVLWPF